MQERKSSISNTRVWKKYTVLEYKQQDYRRLPYPGNSFSGVRQRRTLGRRVGGTLPGERDYASVDTCSSGALSRSHSANAAR